MNANRTTILFLYAVSVASAQSPEPPPRMTPVQLATQIPDRDLSLDPPRVESSTYSLLPQPLAQGNALLRIRFRRLERLPVKFAMATDTGQTWVRDDGMYPDSVRMDGLYTALVPLETAQLLARRAKADQLRLVSGGSVTVPTFDGRQMMTPRSFALPNASELRPGIEFPAGGFGISTLVDPARSLLITDASVISDPARTYKPCPVATGNPNGKWTFKYLMQQMVASTGVPAETLVRHWVDSFGSPQTANGLVAGARPRLKQYILDPWIAASGGNSAPLNLDLAPFELPAIVNRVDLRGNHSYGGAAGELRFVFSVLEPGTCNREGFTVIFEFGVPKKGCGPTRSWAQLWASLPAMPSAAYNTALEAITQQVVVSGAAPAKVAGSALNQLRTNERYEGLSPDDDDWQMREYKLQNTSNGPRLILGPVARTPALSYTNSAALANFINARETQILAEKHNVPLLYPSTTTPFRGADAPALLSFFWKAPGVNNLNARHKFALNTCSGCHTGEAGTGFRHVGPGNPVSLSRFLTGVTVPDPVDPLTSRSFNDLARRAADMEDLINNPCVLSGVQQVPIQVH